MTKVKGETQEMNVPKGVKTEIVTNEKGEFLELTNTTEDKKERPNISYTIKALKNAIEKLHYHGFLNDEEHEKAVEIKQKAVERFYNL